MIQSRDPILGEFPDHSYEQWHAAAVALLKGASFEKRLVSRTREGIEIQPLYRREDIAGLDHHLHYPGMDSRVRGSLPGGFLQNGWEVSQELVASTPVELNQLIHEALQAGQSELNIRVGNRDVGRKPAGVSLDSIQDVHAALDAVLVDAVSIWWRCSATDVGFHPLILAALAQLGVPMANLRGGFENDPLSELMVNGSLQMPLSSCFDQMSAVTGFAMQHAPQLHTIAVSGDVWHHAGATAVQELACVLATAVCYIEEMRLRGHSPHDVMPRIRVHLAVGSDYFMEIAKIRAARWLWSRLAVAYGVNDAPLHIHGFTSRWNKTLYDPHTNMLRVTAESFAAVVAGVDSLHIGPYDEISGSTDAFSRRIARNIHAILREECGLDRVIDPAGGAPYVEWLTDQVAAKSWTLFQEIEEDGGMVSAICSGKVQDAVEAVCAQRFADIRRRKERIVGTNVYPALDGKKIEVKSADVPVGKLPACQGSNPLPDLHHSARADWVKIVVDALNQGASASDICKAVYAGCASDSAEKIRKLVSRRAAEEYEALRDASASYAQKSGHAPGILQINFGSSRKYRMRADWTTAFFQVAGFAVDAARDFLSLDDAVTALTDSLSKIAVIVSDDESYLEHAEAIAMAVKSARPDVFLLLAGMPGERENAVRAAGVDDFVHLQRDNYELNCKLLEVVGIIPNKA